MVLRKDGWRIVTLAAAGFAAASASPGQPSAQSFADPTVAGGGLVWGGHVPPPPRPGETAVYVPSPAYGDPEPALVAPTAFQGVQPTPPQFLPPPVEPSASTAGVPTVLPSADVPAAPGDYGRTYPVQAAPATGLPAPVQEAALPPLEPATILDDGGPSGEYGALPEADFDPWEGLTEPTPGASEPDAPVVSAPPAPVETPNAVPSYAALERTAPPAAAPDRGWSLNPFRWGRGRLERETPDGYRALPREEASCRRELRGLGAEFTEADSVGNGRTHGIRNPVRVSVAARGIAMQPPALLACRTALQTARWLDDDVRSAARWGLWKRPSGIINASSYRVSRIAGSRTISEHALGNALDIRGIRFTDGSTMLVEPKGIFSPRERSFQQKIRVAGCKYFGTVLGPGYNRAHDDHFHFDVKARMRPVCK